MQGVSVPWDTTSGASEISERLDSERRRPLSHSDRDLEAPASTLSRALPTSMAPGNVNFMASNW